MFILFVSDKTEDKTIFNAFLSHFSQLPDINRNTFKAVLNIARNILDRVGETEFNEFCEIIVRSVSQKNKGTVRNNLLRIMKLYVLTYYR